MHVYVLKVGDRIQIPSVQISISVTDIDSEQTEIEIESPSGIEVIPVRSETDCDDQPRFRLDDPTSGESECDVDGRGLHRLRNHLNSVSMALHVVQTQVENDLEVDGNLIRQAIEQLKELDSPEAY